MKHEDDRRILESWPEAKIITAKEICVLGEHHHEIKTEKFVLISGNVIMTIANEMPIYLEVGKIYTVYPNQRHKFDMSKGAIMIGLCSHPYDSTDDYK